MCFAALSDKHIMVHPCYTMCCIFCAQTTKMFKRQAKYFGKFFWYNTPKIIN